MISAGHIVRPKVPSDGKYTSVDGTIYNSGDEFPGTVTTGDTYEYGDYIYKYNQYYYGGGSWYSNSSQNGWGVRVKDTSKITYGEILSEIAGKPVKSMYNTFSGCTSLTGTIEVNANPTSYDRCLQSTQITGITGSCSQETKDALMATK